MSSNTTSPTAANVGDKSFACCSGCGAAYPASGPLAEWPNKVFMCRTCLQDLGQNGLLQVSDGQQQAVCSVCQSPARGAEPLRSAVGGLTVCERCVTETCEAVALRGAPLKPLKPVPPLQFGIGWLFWLNGSAALAAGCLPDYHSFGLFAFVTVMIFLLTYSLYTFFMATFRSHD